MCCSMKDVNCCASCHHAPVEVFRRRKRMNSARSVKGKVCATDVQQGLMPAQEVYREYSSRRPNTFQCADAKRRFCPERPPRCTGGSFNREFVNSKERCSQSRGKRMCWFIQGDDFTPQHFPSTLVFCIVIFFKAAVARRSARSATIWRQRI